MYGAEGARERRSVLKVLGKTLRWWVAWARLTDERTERGYRQSYGSKLRVPYVLHFYLFWTAQRVERTGPHFEDIAAIGRSGETDRSYRAGLHLPCLWLCTSFSVWESKSFEGQAENANTQCEMMGPEANWIGCTLPKDILIAADPINCCLT